MDFATYVLKYFATPAAVIAAVAWLTKEIVLQMIKTQSALVVERSRHEMQQDIDKLRYQINRDIEDFKTRFSHLQEKRFEPLLRFYASLSELCSQASCVYTNVKYYPDEEISKDWIEELEELIRKAKQEYFNVRLFLPESIATNSRSLIEKISDAEMAYYVELTGGSENHIEAQKILQRRLAGSYDHELEHLSKEIRFLLGVENNEMMQQRDRTSR
jgi:hypothetical protein